MTEFLDNVIQFAGEHWLWLTGGLVIIVLLVLIALQGRATTLLQHPLLRPLQGMWQWYADHRGARRLTINVLGAGLVIWIAQIFALWVQPALTPDMLFTTPVIGPQGIDVAMIENRRLEDLVSYNGTVLPYQDAVVYTRVDGYVETLHVYPGDFVNAGDILASLETSQLAPRLQHAQAEQLYWEAEYQRDEGLYQAGAIDVSSFDNTRRQRDIARAKLRLIETEMGYATIRSPLAGVVSKRHLYPGVYAKKGVPVVKVEQLNRVRIQFDVAEKDLFWFKPGSAVYLRFPQADPALIRQSFADRLLASDGDTTSGKILRVRAKINTVFPVEDPKTHMGIVEVQLPNPNRLLKTNSYVVAELVRRHMDNALAVPVAALTRVPDRDDPVVFVGPPYSEEGPAERRDVTLGLRTADYVEVLSGLEAGEFVVTRGNRVLRDGQVVRIVHREGGF